MRTRFIGVDVLQPAPVETLDFFHCAPPHLPPYSASILDGVRNCFDDLSVLNGTLEIEKLPIEAALTKFFSDVLPQTIDLPAGVFADDASSSGVPRTELGIDDSHQEYNEILSDKEGMNNPGYDNLQEKGERSCDDAGTTGIKFFQFEAPAVNPFSEMMHDQRVEEKVFSEISHVEGDEDIPSLELRMQAFLEIQQSVYSVCTISTEYFKEQKLDCLEGSSTTGGELDSCGKPFPVFEIDEDSLSVFNDISVRDELETFDSIEWETWVQDHQIPSSDKELLDYKEFDLLGYLSDHCSAQCPRLEVACPGLSQEIDFINGCEDSDICQMLLFHQGVSLDVLLHQRNIILFEEYQFTGMELYNFVELFKDSGKMITVEACDSMFSEAMRFQSFNDLVVSNELILVDDSFRSLPVPILSDNKNILSFHSEVEKILSVLEPESSSTFDGLYLDWHVLEEDKCGKYSSFWEMLEEIDTYNIDSTLSMYDDRLYILKFLLSSDCFDEPNSGEENEISNILLQHMSVPPISVVGVVSRKVGHDTPMMRATGGFSSEIGPAKTCNSVDSVAILMDNASNLNPIASAGRKKYKPSGLSADKNKVPAGSATQVQKWNIKVIPVKLSEEILLLFENFQKSYMDILRNDTVLMKILHCYQDIDGISWLRYSKEELLNHIKGMSAPSTPRALANDNIISLVSLCAIKQMAWYTCYFGLHPTQLYIDKLSSCLQCLKSRLSLLQKVIGDMCRKAEKETTKFHPSLSAIQSVLESNFAEIDKRILVVAEPIFWWSIKKLLNAVGISYYAPMDFWTNNQQDGLNEFSNSRSAMFQANCTLVTYECVSASFPFDKFGIILEYGDSHESSRICNISQKQDSCPRLYFLKLELEDSGVPRAICEGVGMSEFLISSEKANNSEMEELLNFLPVEEHCKRFLMKDIDEGEECFMEPVQSVPLNVRPEAVYVNKSSSPEIVIVVNTRNFDKEMVISRRSTYQKILALEKGGAQIVERDLDLPVDMVVNAANCLAWYDLKNIGKKASASDEAFSCLSLCVENIATTTLTSLSYAFNSCILIFEGEKNFLDAVVESSDELYAAAASLGIVFQIFCSYSPIMTDEIVLSCIEATMKRSRGLYPAMSDSETIGESFLTAFPSINPLSAHGILSSTATLGEFLEQSHDCRMNLVQKYKIPDISVALLGLSCKYGEREDSKSGMTDSSSSASYSSDRFHMKSNQDAGKGKFIDDLSSIDMNVDKLTSSLAEPLPLFSDVHLSPPKASGSTNFWMSEISEIEECKNLGLSSDSKLLHRKRNANMTMNSSKVSSLSGFQMGEGPISEKRKKKMKPWDDEFFAGKQTADMAARTHWPEHDKFENSAEDLIGEVIDTDLCETFRKDISTLNSFSFLPHEVENDSASRINRATNKSSFGATNLANFPIPNDIDYWSDAWISENTSENSSKKVKKNAPDSSLSNCEFRTKQLKGLLHSNELQKTESCYQPMEKIDVDHSSGTPLWNAIHSGGSQQLRESPWTIEFLNRIKEKSRRHQQSLPRGLSPPCFVPSKMKSSASKRKSPSILEYYKYQKDGISEKPADHKRQKQSARPSFVNKHPKASNSNRPTWTPVDKRSKRTLSFTSNGSGGQSKLIWSDDGSHLFQERFLS